MENPRGDQEPRAQIEDLITFTTLKAAAAVRLISAYKLSLAELGAMRLIISDALKVAYYRGFVHKNEHLQKSLEDWRYEHEKTDPYIRRSSFYQPVSAGLWNAVKRRINDRYASKRCGSEPVGVLRSSRPERPGDRKDL